MLEYQSPEAADFSIITTDFMKHCNNFRRIFAPPPPFGCGRAHDVRGLYQ